MRAWRPPALLPLALTPPPPSRPFARCLPAGAHCLLRPPAPISPIPPPFSSVLFAIGSCQRPLPPAACCLPRDAAVLTLLAVLAVPQHPHQNSRDGTTRQAPTSLLFPWHCGTASRPRLGPSHWPAGLRPQCLPSARLPPPPRPPPPLLRCSPLPTAPSCTKRYIHVDK